MLRSFAGIDPARDVLKDPWARPTAGDDALQYLGELGSVADVEEAVLAELSRPDDRDGLWLGAIAVAQEERVEDAVDPLIDLVETEVVGSVRAHVAALGAIRDLGAVTRTVDLAHLEGIDHLEVQRELGEWRRIDERRRF